MALVVQVPAFLGAGARQFCFMLRGLQELQPKLEAHGIPFFLLKVSNDKRLSSMHTKLYSSVCTYHERKTAVQEPQPSDGFMDSY